MITINYNGISEISTASFDKAAFVNSQNLGNFFENTEVWSSVSISYINSASNQKLVIKFKNTENNILNSEFVIPSEARGTQFIVDGITIVDKSNGKIKIRRNNISQNLDILFQFLLTESGEIINQENNSPLNI